MPTRLSHSWMNFEHGFENQPGYLFRSPGANRIHAVRLSDQIDMDGLRVKNRRSSLGVTFRLYLNAETVTCLLQLSKINE